MTIRPDSWIRERAREGMIEPFEERQVRSGTISYGLSSYGYDIRIADEYKIFTNVNNALVDPKRFDVGSFVDFRGPGARHRTRRARRSSVLPHPAQSATHSRKSTYAPAVYNERHATRRGEGTSRSRFEHDTAAGEDLLERRARR